MSKSESKAFKQFCKDCDKDITVPHNTKGDNLNGEIWNVAYDYLLHIEDFLTN